jgi:NAD(P)-dependent dehydrogenase (short-subunit alcohol dehydrogenase family)
MNNTLQGKVALVTGGSSGIGRATALALAQAGAHTVIAARGRERGEETVAEINKAGGEAIFIPADMQRPADIQNLVEQTVATFGRLDIAFNNAASEGGSGRPTADFAEAEYDEVMAVNLKGVWLCMKHEIQQMLRQSPPGGSIVNTSSVNGLGGVRNGALYAASKAGVLGLTKSAAQEYAQQGIRVNALVAGAFRTPMLRRAMERNVGDDPEARRQMEAQYAAAIPLQRLGDPAEAAQAVVWLASDAASYVTGHSLIVDGGLTAYAR